MADRISRAGCPRSGETIALERDGEDLIEYDRVGGYALTDESRSHCAHTSPSDGRRALGGHGGLQ